AGRRRHRRSRASLGSLRPPRRRLRQPSLAGESGPSAAVPSLSEGGERSGEGAALSSAKGAIVWRLFRRQTYRAVEAYHLAVQHLVGDDLVNELGEVGRRAEPARERHAAGQSLLNFV